MGVGRAAGAGWATARALLRTAAELGLARLTLNVFAWNAAAIACYEREGFHCEEPLHGIVEVDGERWRVMRMATTVAR